MSPLHPMEGHDEPRRALLQAFRKGCLPPVLLVHGHAGVGKQRLGLWLGQLLLCEAATDRGPCDSCRGCRLTLRIEHPDLHWYFPVERPPSRGTPERDRDALEEARRQLLSDMRSKPLRPALPPGTRGLHLGTIQNLLRETSRRPAMASNRVFLIAQAEELVAQDSAQEAANALLKILEEPPPATWFVLTSSEPGRLLPTLRSRTSALHLPPIASPEVRDFLVRHTGGSDEDIDRATRLSGGSIGSALGYLPTDDGPGLLEQARKDAFFLLKAALDSDASERFARAISYAPSGARGLHDLLTALESWMRDLAAVATDEAISILNLDGETWLRRTARERAIHPVLAAQSIRSIEAARARAAGNVNPQLLLVHLLRELHESLVTSSATLEGKA